MADLTAPQQRKADFVLNSRNFAAALKSLLEIAQTIEDDYDGGGFSAILNDGSFVPATFFFGVNEDLNKDHILNFIAVALPAFETFCSTNKTTLANLSNNAKIYFE